MLDFRKTINLLVGGYDIKGSQCPDSCPIEERFVEVPRVTFK
jgi:hypothetical protein